MEGLEQTSEIVNSGSFIVYAVVSSLTEWQVEFSVSATDITVNKRTLSGATVENLPENDPRRDDPASGIDAEYLRYGRNVENPEGPGESYNEWVSFSTAFVPTGACPSSVTASDPNVNEGSPFMVFEVEALADESITLDLRSTGHGRRSCDPQRRGG